jgi:hypothetical protein
VSDRFNRVTAQQAIEKIEIGDKIMAGDDETIIAIIDELTANQSTFSQSSLENFLLSHTDSPENYEKAIAAVLRNQYIVVIADAGGDGNGDGNMAWMAKNGGFEALDDELKESARASYDTWAEKREAGGHDAFSLNEYVNYVQARFEENPEAVSEFSGNNIKYTSTRIISIEKSLIERASTLSERDIGRTIGSESDTKTMNDGQKKAYTAMLSGKLLEVLNGAAGTGKSYVLSKMNIALKNNGKTIIGAMLQGKTAQDFERDSGIKSQTLHSLVLQVESGKKKLDENTVLVVDEAGMIGSEQMNKILGYAEKYGCQVRLVGDKAQVQAVSFGDAFAKVSEQTGVTSLTEIMRQKDLWQKQASESFSRHEIDDGLRAYDEHNQIIEHTNIDDAMDIIAQKVRQLNGKETSLVIAKTNREREIINNLIRDDRIEDGWIDASRSVKIGTINVSSGDKIMFNAPDKFRGVLNGTTGAILSIDEDEETLEKKAKVLLDTGKIIEMNDGDGLAVQYGYAVTINKSQGATVDKAFVLASDKMTKNDIYVAMTRHKQSCELHYSREDFETEKTSARQNLYKALSKKAVKAFAGDKEETEVTNNVVQQLMKEHATEKLIERDAQRTSIKKIESEIDVERLMYKLQKTHGVDVEKYQIDENGKIIAGSKSYKPIEFLTDEMHLDYKKQAMQILRETYSEQVRDVHIEKQKPATKTERKNFADYIVERKNQRSNEMSCASAEYRIEKKAAYKDIDKIEVAQVKFDARKKEIALEFDKPNRELLDQFRIERKEAMSAVEPLNHTKAIVVAHEKNKPAMDAIEKPANTVNIEDTTTTIKHDEPVVEPVVMDDEKETEEEKEIRRQLNQQRMR